MSKKEEKERERLPAFKTLDECEAYANEKQDSFYITAFMLEAWIGDTVGKVHREYGGKKTGERSFQNGGAWDSWKAVFGHAEPKEWTHIFGCIGRYSQMEADKMPLYLHTALNLTAIEDKHGRAVSPSTKFPNPNFKGITLDDYSQAVRYIFQRLSEWLDAVCHWEARIHYAIAPKSFSEDEHHDELYAVGLMQRGFGKLSEHGKSWWRFRHDDLAVSTELDKWRVVGQAQSNDKWGELKHPQVDEVAIHCWPLAMRYGWTDHDLRLILRKIVAHPDSYPLRDDREFADYRGKILGLRMSVSGRKKSRPEGEPEGWKVALAMCEKL